MNNFYMKFYKLIIKKYTMTKEEFFEKYNSLEIEKNELSEKLNNLHQESNSLIAEYAKNLFGVEIEDIIYQKSSGENFRVCDISVEGNKINLYICGIKHYYNITEQEFLEEYVTKEGWNELIKKQKENNEYQEYLRLKEKFEKN